MPHAVAAHYSPGSRRTEGTDELLHGFLPLVAVIICDSALTGPLAGCDITARLNRVPCGTVSASHSGTLIAWARPEEA
jgi:hypothetical protein